MSAKSLALMVSCCIAATSAWGDVTVTITGGCPTGSIGFVGSITDGTNMGYFESCDAGTLAVARFRDSSNAVLAEHRFDKSLSGDASTTFVVDGVTITPSSQPGDFTSEQITKVWAVRDHVLGPLFNHLQDELTDLGISTTGYPFGVLLGGSLVFHSETSTGSGGGSGTMPCDSKGKGCCGEKDNNCRGCCGKACDGCSGFCHSACRDHDDCEREGGSGPDANCFGKLAKAGNKLSGCAVGRHSSTECSCEGIGLQNGNNC